MNEEAEMRYEFNRALIDLPQIPNMAVLQFLMHAAMNSRGMDFWNRGKELQRDNPNTIPWKTEYECAAGMWDCIRSGLLPEGDAGK